MGDKKKGTSFRSSLSFPSSGGLRREASERATNVTFTEALQGTIAKLANALARDSQQGTDLLERVLPPAFESEVQTQHLRIPRGKRRQRGFDFVVEEAVHCFLF